MLLCSNALVVAHCTLVRHLLTDPRQSDILPFGPGRGTNAIRSTKTREFITLLGGAAIAWPLAARAQQGENPTRIGFLPIGLPSNAYDQSMVEAFRQGLREAGLVDGRHVTIDLVWVSNESEFHLAVSGLVQRGAKLLVTAGSSASLAAKRHTSTI